MRLFCYNKSTRNRYRRYHAPSPQLLTWKVLASLRESPPLPTPLATLFHNLPLPRIIDVHSPSHTGKTHLLYHLITQIILPDFLPQQTTCLTSSPSRAVFFIDCDGRFDITRLRHLLTTFVQKKLAENRQGGFIHHHSTQGPSDDEIGECVHAALANLYLFQPTSGIGLLATVKSLPNVLSRPCNKNITLGLICIDSLTAFHHVLRSHNKLAEYYAILSSSLRSLSSLFAIPIITTSWSLFAHTSIPVQGRGYLGTGPSHPPSVSAERPIWKQYFPVEWLRGVDQRIILHKREVRGFMVDIPLAEAEREKERRMEVVKRGAVIGWLENDEKREFEMFITDDGVLFPQVR